MLKKNMFYYPKVWFKFSKSASDGRKLRFRWEQLSQHRYKEFIDFNIDYYVKHEITHIASGINKSPEAMAEYRNIVTEKFKDRSFNIAICCLDDEISDIVAFSSLYLYEKGEIYGNSVQAQTKEVKKFLQVLKNWNDIFPVPKVLEKYGVERFMDDAGCAIHPNYRGYGITNEISLIRCMMCKENAVPLTGAWITAVGTQKGAKRDGWETIYEIKYDEMEKRLDLKFQNSPPTLIYSIRRVD